MRITDGVEMLEISAILENGSSVIHPVLIWDNEDVILVDTGLPNQFTQIKEAIEAANISFDRLSKIIITHHDMDHIGTLRSILDTSSQNIDVFAHQLEVPFIEAEIPPIRLTQLDEALIHLSGDHREKILPLYETLKNSYKKYKVFVNNPVADGETLACCGGVVFIHTPGHTLGHTSLYLTQKKILITGDIIQIKDNQLAPAPKATIIDYAASAQSIRKLAQYKIDTLLCYHGGLYCAKDINQRMLELANTYE